MLQTIEQLKARKAVLAARYDQYKFSHKFAKMHETGVQLTSIEASIWEAENPPLMEVEEIHSDECVVEGAGRMYAKQGSVSRVRYSDPADPGSWEVL